MTNLIHDFTVVIFYIVLNWVLSLVSMYFLKSIAF